MKKRVFGNISSFILGTQSSIFTLEQTDVYGPPPEPKNDDKIIDITQPTVYGPPQDPNVSTINGGQIFSIIASILLFIIGIIVILKKNINKKVKIITVIILLSVILALLLLAKFVF